tara:strand:- start:447 stop:647 length:201 start_codon:yes stop_codon:yes gene_type:complete
MKEKKMKEEKKFYQLIKILSEIALYSFEDVQWIFDDLTEEEKKIIGSQKTMNDLKYFVESYINIVE